MCTCAVSLCHTGEHGAVNQFSDGMQRPELPSLSDETGGTRPARAVEMPDSGGVARVAVVANQVVAAAALLAVKVISAGVAAHVSAALPALLTPDTSTHLTWLIYRGLMEYLDTLSQPY